MLNTIHHGTPGAGPTLLIAHGLFGSARNWNVIAKRLSDTYHVVCVDMRNHGDSPWFESHTYADMAADLARVIETLPGGQADVLGHSMGGKAAMVLSLIEPERVRRLIVADIAPVTYSHTQGHLIDAMRGVNLDAIASRAEAAKQLNIDDPGISSFLLQSLDLKLRRWRLNLDVLDREMEAIIGFPDVSGAFERDALFVSGAASDYVSSDHRDKINNLFLNAKFTKIKEAGHWLHAEQPRVFEQVIRYFLG